MKKALLLVGMFCLSLLVGVAWAQQRTVTGKVTSEENGEPLPGVNVVLKGTTVGGVTDISGNYSLNVPAEGGVLVFSFIGLETMEVEIGNQSIINVRLLSDVKQLSEIVVVGYGEVDKRKLTSSISSISGDEIALRPVASFDQALAGKAAGVQINIPSGLLGEAPRIRIRGTNSITSGASPLIVVDGVPIISGNQSTVTRNNPLGDINPNDIESFEILKDGSATAIYGSRATNGVILITTKKGKSGQTNINYNGFAGFNTVSKRFDVLNAEEFITISNEKFATTGTAPQAFPGPNNVDTDWQDAIFQNGVFYNHNLSVSGGSDKTTFYSSLGWMDQEGAIIGNAINRASLTANVDYKGVEWLDLGVNVNLARTITNGLNQGTNSLSGVVSNATQAFPNVPIYDTEHPTGYNLTDDNQALGRGNNLQNIAFNLPNLRYTIDKNSYKAASYRTLANTYAQINILPSLSIRSQLGADLINNEDLEIWDPVHGDGSGTNGYMYQEDYRTFRWNWHNFLTYKTTIADKHSFNFVVGNEYQKTTSNYYYGSGQDFSNIHFIKKNIITGTFGTQNSGGGYVETGFESLFGRLNYDFDNKYLLSLSLRKDAISSLPKDNRSGTFFGGSLGWSVSNEDFFSNINPSGFISLFKVRGSYAEVGNVDIGSFPYVGTYGPALYASQNGIAFDNVGNTSLKWETSNKIDIGFDLGLLSDKIDISFDWYKNDVSDLILAAPTPPSMGLPGNVINKNIGSMVNSGIELSVNTENLNKNAFRWSTSFTFSTNKNEITALNNDEDIIFNFNINRVGESIGALYGYQYEGVNYVNGFPIYKKGDGTLIQGNVTNNRYYVYNPSEPNDLSTTSTLSATDDKVVLGQTNPAWFGGIGNNLSYKGIDFEVFLNYSGGNKILNVTKQEGMAMEFSNNHKEILNRWTPENPHTYVPRMHYANSNFVNLSNNAVSRFVEDGDFLRVQNITLGYNLPTQLLNKYNFKGLRIYGQVQNAFVFTKYTGVDPELNWQGQGGTLIPTTNNRVMNSQVGIDYNTSPLLRTFTFGLNLSL